MIVVIDTNLWKRHLYLNSAAGAAVRFFLRRQGARLGLPEVVRLEIERHFSKDIESEKARAEDGYRKLLGLVGELPPLNLHHDDPRELLNRVFAGFDLVDVPFSIESARDSFLRTINKVPPSKASQQFKDGVIWADCVRLASQDEVVLVTDDTAFFEDGTLAEQLQTEARDCLNNLRVMKSLEELLLEIETKQTINTGLFSAMAERDVSDFLGVNGFRLGTDIDWTYKLFITGALDELFVTFEGKGECVDEGGEGRHHAVLSLSGEGRFDAAKGVLSNVNLADLVVEYTTAEGVSDRRRRIYMRASVGPAAQRYSVRRAIS